MAIYDCFTFFNEIDLLKIRMKLLDPVVDYFVLAELPFTHRGEPKELIFKSREKEFEQYKDKIIYVCPKVEDVPGYKGPGDWTIENYQRNCIRFGIMNCQPEDLIIISDIDEFPNPTHLRDMSCHVALKTENNIRATIKKRMLCYGYLEKSIASSLSHETLSLIDTLEYMPVAFEQDLFYYYMNCRASGKWYGSVICKFKNMGMPNLLRIKQALFPIVKNGGWHFSYVGGMDRVKSKLQSIIDSNHDIIQKMEKYSNDDEYIIDCMKKGIDIYGRGGSTSKFDFIRPEEIGIEDYQFLMDQYPNMFNLNSID